MKRGQTLVQEEGIGATINRFENLPEQTVGTFNRLFPNCQLKGYDSDLAVTIGDYNYGIRKVTINDTIELDHEFSHIDFTLGHRVVIKFVLFYPSGETIGQYNSMNDAAKELGTCTTTLRSHILKGKYVMRELINE